MDDKLPAGELSYAWFGSSLPDDGQISGREVEVTLPRGSHRLSLVVSDDHQRSSPEPFAIDVVDTTPPQLNEVSVEPACLWPPNHKWIGYRLAEDVSANMSDVCDESPELRVVDIRSNESPDAPSGDGHHRPDTQSSQRGFCLRAERNGRGSGRKYTVTFVAVDDAGNRSEEESVEVRVPHDQRPGRRCREVEEGRRHRVAADAAVCTGETK